VRTSPILLVLLTWIFFGCATSPQVKPARLASDRLEALAEAHAADETFAIRMNPVPCDCPPFEVRFAGQDHRVFLEPTGPDTLSEQVRARLEAEAAKGNSAATLTVRGKLSDNVRVAPNRAWCLVLKVLAICEPEGCPPVK